MLMVPNRCVGSPWQELRRLRREMNQLFDSSLAPDYRRAPGFPAMNVWTSEDGAVVTAELPGVSIEDIDVSIVNETLTLSGGREPDQAPEGARYHRRERNYGHFSRTIQLPFSVQLDAVEATLSDGVLRVLLPRTEEEKRRRITVKGS